MTNNNAQKICEQCGVSFTKRKKEAYWQFEKRTACSKRCAGILNNPRKPNTDLKSRYRLIKTPSGRKLEHRWVVEQHLGRELEPWEHVHHINHDRLDNRIENLEVVTVEEHGKRHTYLPVTKSCVQCGEEFTPHKTKRRIAKTCSPECKSARQKVLNAERRQQKQAQAALTHLLERTA